MMPSKYYSPEDFNVMILECPKCKSTTPMGKMYVNKELQQAHCPRCHELLYTWEIEKGKIIMSEAIGGIVCHQIN